MPPAGIFTQENRFLILDTPLGPNKLLLRGFTGTEGISQLFYFQLDLLAEVSNTIKFEDLLGQPLTFGVKGMEAGINPRWFNGIVTQFSQGARDQKFAAFQATIHPAVWKLTKKTQSRIFQHLTIPDILKKVLQGYDVTWDIQGTWQPRDYCVQYRESDWAFASRLMEEEGIFYFFEHSSGAHKMIVGNTPKTHTDLPDAATLIFEGVEGGGRDEERVTSWEKVQDLRSGKTLLWDYNFQLQNKKLDAEKPIQDSAAAGSVTHKLKTGGNDKFELYDFPGFYAKRFDGIDKGGGEAASRLEHIFTDNARTVGIREQEETTPGLVIHAMSNCRHVMPGYKFQLVRHFDANGSYVITTSTVEALEGAFSSWGAEDESAEDHYSNRFTCIPAAIPFRPDRKTELPIVHGPQTAIVVGPPGEEIFTDKYGRVKVQFHWDRDGQRNADSSCWVRVGTPWAGKNWGIIHIPRIGQEVIVAFEHGHPDCPLIVGSVYNPDQMPPFKLPPNKTISTRRSNSTLKGEWTNFNELRFEDKKGKEQVFLHGERDKDERIKRISREWVGASRHLIVGSNQHELIGGEKHIHVKGDQFNHNEGSIDHTIDNFKMLKVAYENIEHVGENYLQVDGKAHTKIGGEHTESVGGKISRTAGGDYHEKTGMNYAHEAGMEIHLKAGMKVIIEAGVQLSLKGPGGFVDIGPAGVTIQGTMVLINSGGAAGSGSGSSPGTPEVFEDPVKPKDPAEADPGTRYLAQ